MKQCSVGQHVRLLHNIMSKVHRNIFSGTGSEYPVELRWYFGDYYHCCWE